MSRPGRTSPKLLEQLSNEPVEVEKFIENISGIPSNTTLRQRKDSLKHLKKQKGKGLDQPRDPSHSRASHTLSRELTHAHARLF